VPDTAVVVAPSELDDPQAVATENKIAKAAARDE